MFTLRDVDIATGVIKRGRPRIVCFNGESRPLRQWCREVGIGETTVYERIKRGWPRSRWFEMTTKQRKLSAWMVLSVNPDVKPAVLSRLVGVDWSTASRWKKEVSVV